MVYTIYVSCKTCLTPTDVTIYYKESYGQLCQKLCQRPSIRTVYRNLEESVLLKSVKSGKCTKQVSVEKVLLKQN